jgi:hypothetical protein
MSGSKQEESYPLRTHALPIDGQPVRSIVEQSSLAFVYAGFALLGLAGAGIMIYTTAKGAGIGGDATIYLAAARNLLGGKGLGLVEPQGGFRVLPYSAPLYPLLLAGLGGLGIDLAGAARWLDALLYGATICLVGAAVLRFTRDRILALLSALLVLLSPVLVVRVFAWAMSEPVFLFAGFLGLFLALDYSGHPRRGVLVGAGLAGGMSLLARYIGLGFIGTVALVLLLLDRRAWMARIKATGVFLTVSLLPMLVWVVYDYAQTQTVASRSIQAGVGLGARVLSVLAPLKEAVLFWLVPDSWVDAPPYPHALNTLMLAGVILAVLTLLAIVWQQMRAKRPAELEGSARLALGLGIFVAVYLALTLVVFVSTYPPITLDNRMISPIYVAALLIVVVLIGMLLRLEPTRRWLRIGAWVVLLGFAATYLYRTPRIVQETHRTGLGYLASEYSQSATLEALKALPAGTPIVTNEVTLVLYYTGQPAYALVSGPLVDPHAPFTAYGSDPSDPGQAAFRAGAALVLFNSINDTLNGIYGAQGPERLAALTHGLYKAYTGADGAIYLFKAP